MEQAKIGKFIQILRKEKLLTQKELANQLGVSDRAISKWENGRGMPDVSLMKGLCEALGITINELLSGERIDHTDYLEKSEAAFLDTMVFSDTKMKRKDILLRTVAILAMLLVLGVVLWIYILPVSRGYFYADEEIGITLILKRNQFSDIAEQDITERVDTERLRELLPLMRVSLGTEQADTYWPEDVTYQIFGYFKSGPRERQSFCIYLGDWNYLTHGSFGRGHQILNPEIWLTLLGWFED